MAQLRTFYEENKERFLTFPSRSFEHVYFSFASAKQPEKPEQFIKQLEAASDISGFGDFSQIGKKLKNASFQTTATTFGKPFAQVIFSMALNEWRGPIESFRGIHYVRVTAKREPELPPFEKMESYLRRDYLMVKNRESQQRKIDEMKKN